MHTIVKFLKLTDHNKNHKFFRTCTGTVILTARFYLEQLYENKMPASYSAVSLVLTLGKSYIWLHQQNPQNSAVNSRIAIGCVEEKQWYSHNDSKNVSNWREEKIGEFLAGHTKTVQHIRGILKYLVTSTYISSTQSHTSHSNHLVWIYNICELVWYRESPDGC